jgi:ubiquinone/menaquinone biosynthesis C-methylase UbiE
MAGQPPFAVPPEVLAYYSALLEPSRLTTGLGRLEGERTRELLRRMLPPPPARILDVGGAAGVYAFWLAGLGYSVHLIDAVSALVEEASRINASAEHKLGSLRVADARALPEADESADAVLVLGPLYHLTDRDDRLRALAEARRVLRPQGVLAASGISRYAAALDGLVNHPGLDAALVAMRHRSVADGQYRNDTDNRDYFVTAYFHRPEDLAAELTAASFSGVRVYGIEGPGAVLSDFDRRWNDPDGRHQILTAARLLEEERSVIGASAHLLAVGRKRSGQ